jgi:hypothetical protein
MVYLEKGSRTAMKADLAGFYGALEAQELAAVASTATRPAARLLDARIRRRMSRTPY